MRAELLMDWDDANVKHLKRHHVKPSEFEEALRNDPILFDHDNLDGEDRWTGLGATDALRVLTLSFTIRNGRVRAITAFDASRKRALEFWQHRGV